MNREIKFRAWKGGEMLHWNRHVKRAFPSFLGSAVLMEYIGAEDHNGREIYEGDIVQWVGPEGESDSEVRELVEWKVKEAVGGQSIVEINPFGRGDFGWSPFCVEVIGDKFRNPELLEDN